MLRCTLYTVHCTQYTLHCIGSIAGMQMDGRPCGSLCYIMKLERLARELGVQNKDKVQFKYKVSSKAHFINLTEVR